MPIWRDPLDELIADLERVAPASSVVAFEIAADGGLQRRRTERAVS